MQRKLKILTCVFLSLFITFYFSGVSSKGKLRILISNDDGYDAPGIKALANELSKEFEIFVAAPAKEESGSGHGVTTREPIFVNEIDRNWYSITARPATCVSIAINTFMKNKPDLVVTGINSGLNLGLVTYLSGTVGGAREAVILGYPAIATSTNGINDEVYKKSAFYIRKLINELQSKNLIKPGLFLNVNVPESIVNKFNGFKVVRLSNKLVANKYEKRVSPRGDVYYWNSFRKILQDNNDETDIGAYQDGYVTITPLALDTTDTKRIEEYSTLLEEVKGK